MKRSLTLFLAISFIFSIAVGCSKDTGTSDTPATKTETQTTDNAPSTDKFFGEEELKQLNIIAAQSITHNPCLYGRHQRK